jgi:hypothetical protein
VVSWPRRQQYELSSLILLANNFGESYNLWSFSYSFPALLFRMTVFKIINHVLWCSCHGVHWPSLLGFDLIFFSRNGIYCDCWCQCHRKYDFLLPCSIYALIACCLGMELNLLFLFFYVLCAWLCLIFLSHFFQVKELLSSPMNEVTSSLHLNDGLGIQNLVLSAVGLGKYILFLWEVSVRNNYDES